MTMELSKREMNDGDPLAFLEKNDSQIRALLDDVDDLERSAHRV